MAQAISLGDEVNGWLKKITEYDRVFAKYEARVNKIIKRYRDEQSISGTTKSSYPILWANIQTLVPSCYAKTPKPEVTRRFGDDGDNVGRVASLILSRAIEFELEHYPDFDSTMKTCVLDRFLGGRGTAWVRYEPKFSEGPALSDDADEDGTERQQALVDERTPVDYVHWQDFGHSVARTWDEVGAVWRRVYMSRKALVERFGEEIGGAIPLDANPNKEATQKQMHEGQTRALIYEIWDKDGNEVLWMSKSHPEMLDRRTPGDGEDSPVELENFFPCPRPLYGTLTAETLVPVPDFVQYQYQARQLDVIADRIDGIVKALKVVGVYDASVEELKRLLTEGTNNTLVPVKNWGGLTEKGGLKGAIDLIPLDMIATALEQLYAAQKSCKDEIAYILGLADIVHGVGQAGETATAQGIKGNYVGLRLNCSQADVARFASDIIRIKAELVAQYDVQTLSKLAAVDQMVDADKDPQVLADAFALIRNKPLRTFRIQVDADSLVNIDEAQEKADRTEFISAFSGLMRDATPLLQAEPAAASMVLEIIKFGVGAYKAARPIEGVIDKNLDMIAKMEEGSLGQQKPNPDLQKIQAQQQAQAQQSQIEFQYDTQRLQMQNQLEEQKQQLQAQQVQHTNELEAQRAALQSQHELQIAQMKNQHELAMQSVQLELEKWRAELQASTQIEVAQIAAKNALDVAATKAASNTIVQDLGGI